MNFVTGKKNCVFSLIEINFNFPIFQLSIVRLALTSILEYLGGTDNIDHFFVFSFAVHTFLPVAMSP